LSKGLFSTDLSPYVENYTAVINQRIR